MSEDKRVTVTIEQETIGLMRLLGYDITGNKLARACSAFVNKGIRKVAQERGLLPEDIPIYSTDPKIMARELEKTLQEIQQIEAQLGRKVLEAQSIARELSRG